MSASLQLLHLGRHGRLVPFLVRAWNGAFVGDELVELAADGARIVVAGYFAFDFFEFDVAVVAFVGGGCARGVGVDVLFIGRALCFVFGRGFGVRSGSIGGGAGAAGAACCFGHCGRYLIVKDTAVWSVTGRGKTEEIC